MVISQEKLRVATDSIGPNESPFECEHIVESLEQFQKMWKEIQTMEDLQHFAILEQIIVSTSNCRGIIRVVDF